jgi:hypothetical protein
VVGSVLPHGKDGFLVIVDGFISLLTGAPGDPNLPALATKVNAVTALIGSRAYKNALPRGYRLPALAIHRYGGNLDYDMAGPNSESEDQIQIDIYGDTPDDCQAASEAVRALLAPFVGTLSDGSRVQACYLERDMDMPYLPHADAKGIANRASLGFKVVSY